MYPTNSIILSSTTVHIVLCVPTIASQMQNLMSEHFSIINISPESAEICTLHTDSLNTCKYSIPRTLKICSRPLVQENTDSNRYFLYGLIRHHVHYVMHNSACSCLYCDLFFLLLLRSHDHHHALQFVFESTSTFSPLSGKTAVSF